MKNLDSETVDGFGVEWSRFDQSDLSEQELRAVFARYFEIFPWEDLPPDAVGFDAGCGSGRWARLVAGRVGQLHCVDASADALAVAERNLARQANCSFHHATVDEMPIRDESMDFGYSLGVLHHVPNTERALRACTAKLKPGAPFLVYLYYAFDNRPAWFARLWRASDIMRRFISRMPPRMKTLTADALAVTVYFPLARAARLAEKRGFSPELMPLSAYRHLSFYTMRTDALDRFGTRLEQRFTAREIRKMMEGAGLERVRFSDQPPYWCAVGFKKSG